MCVHTYTMHMHVHIHVQFSANLCLCIGVHQGQSTVSTKQESAQKPSQPQTTTTIAAYSANQPSLVDGQMVSRFFVVLQHYRTR